MSIKENHSWASTSRLHVEFTSRQLPILYMECTDTSSVTGKASAYFLLRLIFFQEHKPIVLLWLRAVISKSFSTRSQALRWGTSPWALTPSCNVCLQLFRSFLHLLQTLPSIAIGFRRTLKRSASKRRLCIGDPDIARPHSELRSTKR